MHNRHLQETSDTHRSGIAGGMGEKTTTHNTTTEESSKVNESQEHSFVGGGPIEVHTFCYLIVQRAWRGIDPI